MGSGYFGEPNMGNDHHHHHHHQRSGSSSSTTSRKGKKGSSDKPKQPQRGLGVAQLEKIRLHSQMGCNYLPNPPTPNYPHQEDMRVHTAYSTSSSFSYSSPSTASYSLQGHQSIMMNLGEYDRSNIRYGDSQAATNQRWNADNTFLEAQHYAQPGITRHLLNLEVEDSLRKKKKKDRSDSMGSSSQNSDSNGSQELDLELRLSL